MVIGHENAVDQRAGSQPLAVHQGREPCAQPFELRNSLIVRFVLLDDLRHVVVLGDRLAQVVLGVGQQFVQQREERDFVVLRHEGVHHIRDEGHDREIIAMVARQADDGPGIGGPHIIHDQHIAQSTDEYFVCSGFLYRTDIHLRRDRRVVGQILRLPIEIGYGEHVLQKTLVDKLHFLSLDEA